jgi:hypothetical protein
VRFTTDGTHTVGWYSDFGPYYGTSGKPYFLYAYKVGTATYGGQGLYDDDTSEVYFRKPGDPIGVTYLLRAPWISTMKAEDLTESMALASIPLLFFWGGICFTLWPHRKERTGLK